MRRGFTIILAITVLMLLGSLAALICAGARGRGQDVARDFYGAQARQLVLAGLSQCPRILANKQSEANIAVPEVLAQPASLAIRVTDRQDNRASINIAVICGPVNQTQAATFTREGENWRLAALGE